MSEIKKAIEDYLERQGQVYKSDEERIKRDTLGAARAVKDHVGRWLWELLQNSDDARADKVIIQITHKAIYIADNGEGLKPDAVKSISGTDFSDKTKGTIGRKGIGFKSVYNITSTPQVFSGDEGLEFSEERGREWLAQRGFSDPQFIPYMWLPFYVLRTEAEKNDSALKGLQDYKTVIKLLLAQEPKELKEFQAYSLLPFRYLRRLEINREGEEPHILEVSDNGDGVWTVSDSRIGHSVKWSVFKTTAEPPEKVKATLDSIDRQWVESRISFLIAAPFDATGIIQPLKTLKNYLPLHVFYPAENDLSPVPILLHAEFLVKSDRTAIIPIPDNNFNDWIAGKLADSLIIFLHKNYNDADPAAYLRLLVSSHGLEIHHTTKILWNKFVESAKRSLKLPDINGELTLAASDARFIDVSVKPEKAKKILEETTFKDSVVHSAINDDRNVKKVLRELNCKGYDDNSIIEVIDNEIGANASNREWIWNCWDWIAEWVAKEPYGDKHVERLKRIKNLPILPSGGEMYGVASLEDAIIAWWSDTITINIPEWLTITFIDSWFSNRVRSLPDNSDPLKKLTAELGFKTFSEDTILRALSKAIEHYWERNEENPERFIEFLISGNWHEEYAPLEGLTRCPIHATIEGGNAEQWVEAGKAYFGKEWGEEHIAHLYDGVQGIPWACMPADNQDKYRKVIEWLGVAAYPRIVSGDKSWDERWRIEKYIEGDSRPVERPSPSPLILDSINLSSLSPLKSSSLICLFARNWKNYYHPKTDINIKCEGPRGGWRPSEQVPTLWWVQIKDQLQPPVIKNDAASLNFSRCWLPDKETSRAIGDLLPIIDLDKFSTDKRIVEKWLKDTVCLRSNFSEITQEEWQYILSQQIPSIVDINKLATDESYRDRVKTWYKTCLNSLDEQENISDGALNEVPLLCRKGDIWKLITNEERWIADDNQTADAFKDDIWQITFPKGLHSSAKKYFGIKLLSENIKDELKPYEQCGDNSRLQQILSDVLPFVYTWESYNGKKESERLKSDLKGLKVITVNRLEAEIILMGAIKVIERHWDVDVDGQMLLITEGGGSTESYLAQALSKFLNSKTEPEFYENLIRCKDDNERKAKLISKNVPSDEIEKYLREFQSIKEGYFPGKQTEAIKDSVHGPSGTQYGPEGAGPTSPMVKEQETLTTSGGVSVTQHTTTGNLSTGGGTASLQLRTIRLKDPNTAKIVMADTAAIESYTGGLSGGGGSIGGGYDSRELSHEEKLELERLSRAVVKRRLEENGWEVQEMPFDNPGFDLKANKNERKSHVEIKGHLKKSNTVELTARQFIEYHQCKTSTENVQWELWNVENLSDNVIDDIRISIYSEIPEEALMAREFNVDLRKCQRSGS